MKTPQINEFRLFAHGEAFDPEAYLAITPLQFDGVWHKGELRPDHPKSSGVFKVLGDGWAVPIWEQEWIAINYLTNNRDALKALTQQPGVTTFILGLHYRLKLEEGIISFTLGPSAQLMQVALDIGIAPTYYVVIDQQK